MKRITLFCFMILILQTGKEVQAEQQLSSKIEMLPWEKVDILLPKYTIFTVMDVETRGKFQVQRRAGGRHADVQPLTSKDTAIMKSIYGGKWSWKRRAIIIIYKDYRIAASMHGMPHGAGTLNNNFPGHFCIHLNGSTTHHTKSMDLAHMLMILKAAGKLEEYLEKANPDEVIHAYIQGFKQKDVILVTETSLQNLKWEPLFNQIENVKITRLGLLPVDDIKNEMFLKIPIELDWYFINKGKKTVKGNIELVRFSLYEPWRVNSISFLEKIYPALTGSKTPP